MSSAEIEGCSVECLDVRIQIYSMFANFTPLRVDQTKARINEHLKRCLSCRTLLEKLYEEKEKERQK